MCIRYTYQLRRLHDSFIRFYLSRISETMFDAYNDYQCISPFWTALMPCMKIQLYVPGKCNCTYLQYTVYTATACSICMGYVMYMLSECTENYPQWPKPSIRSCTILTKLYEH